MNKTIIAAAVLAAMTACNKNIIEHPASEAGFGYINLGVSADTEMVMTKGVAENADYNDFNVTLKQGEAVKWTKEYKDITEADLKVAAGTYTIEVENLTSDEAHPAGEKGEVRVSGSAQADVKAGLPEDVTVACRPVNAKVSFNYTAKFAEVFKTSSVKVGTAARTLAVNMQLDTDSKETLDAAFFESENLTWTLNTTNANDVEKTYAKTFKPSANKWTVVTFTVGDVAGTINVTITVNNQITEEFSITEEIDPLQGTEVIK